MAYSETNNYTNNPIDKGLDNVSSSVTTSTYKYVVNDHVVTEQENMIKKAGLPNPTLWGDNEKYTGETVDEMYAPYISKYKIIQLYVGPAAEPSAWGTTLGGISIGDNWRTISDSNGSLNVSNKIVLIPTSMEFPQFSVSNDLKDTPLDDVLGKLGNSSQLISSLNSALEKASMFSPKYNDCIFKPIWQGKVWNGTDSLKVPSSITFNFNFGQAGLFDAKEEVVKPIIALMYHFAPKSQGGNMIRGPVPTGAYTLSKYAAYAKGKINELVGKVVDGKSLFPKNPFVGEDGTVSFQSAASGALDVASNFKTAIVNSYDRVAKTVLSDKNNKMIVYKMGNIVIGPCYVGGVDAKFDFSSVDENGYPTSGSATMSGIIYPITANTYSINVFPCTRESSSTYSSAFGA